MKKIKKYYQYFSTRSEKATVAITLALLLSLLVTAAVLAVGTFDPTTTWNVTPELKSFPDDRVCPAGSYLVQDQFQSLMADGSMTYILDGKSVTVEIDYIDQGIFNFEVIGGTMARLFVKSRQYLLYQYEPPVSGATNTGPVSYDTGVHANANPNGGKYQGVSHLDFCLIPGGEPLEVTKTAAGTYDRTVEWDLVKNVNEAGNDLTEYTGEAGDEFFPDWLLFVDKTETLDNYKVIGDITINNPNEFPVDFSVADELDDGTVADVTCPSDTIPANDNVICTYEAFPADDSAALNTATVTSLTTGVDGDMATAPVSFTENLIGFDEGTLTDDRFPLFSEIVTDDDEFTLPETFECSTDPGDYTDGEYTETVTNTAYLNGNINLEDDAAIKLTCTLPALEPTKDAVGSYDRTVEWDLNKYVNAVDQESVVYIGGPGAIFPTDWLLYVDKTETLDNYKVIGNISIYNPAAIAQFFWVSDMLDDMTVAAVDCDPLTEGDQGFGWVAADSTAVCSYEAYPDDGSATLNTATVTADGNIDQYAYAPVSFTENLIGFDSGTLTDDRFPLFEEIVNGDANFTLEEDFVCPPEGDASYVDGSYEYQVVNTAYLNGNINLQDSATVTVRCEAPEKPSIDIEDVIITEAGKSPESYAKGSFVIRNASGGDGTYVTLGEVWIEFFSVQPRGIKTDHMANCVISPEATGYVLDPHEAKQFSFDCDAFNPEIAINAQELTAIVYVDGATNQIGEFRDRLWWATSSPYNFE